VNGPHDLGGMMGFGPVGAETDEPVFHARWEGRVFGLELSFGAVDSTPIDVNRHRHENTPPPKYLNSSYYQVWLGSLERRVVESGWVTAAELKTGRCAGPPKQARGLFRAADVPSVIARRTPYTRPPTAEPRFAQGDRVLTLNMHPRGHTRLPRYARGRVGTIERIHGFMVFPDSNARGGGEDPQWCYGVAFAATELWGADADPTLSVALDLWEPYLAPA
jgi:nitrile hydratase subunit beta